MTIASGYAFAAGQWIEHDEPLILPVKPSGNTDDRTDALVARVDYINRVVNLEVVADYSDTDGENQYTIVLYLIKVRRGATSITPSDITDMRANKEVCGTVIPFSAIAGDVLRVYQFLTSGIDTEVNRLVDMSNAVIAKADAEIAKLDAEIAKVGGTAQIGELITTRKIPAPVNEWILCDGGNVPAEYQALSELLSGTLPDLSAADDRYRTYIYGGKPAVLRARQ